MQDPDKNSTPGPNVFFDGRRGLHIALYIRDVLGLKITDPTWSQIPPLEPRVPAVEGVDAAVVAAASASWVDWWRTQVEEVEPYRHIRDEIIGRAWQSGTQLARLVLSYIEDAEYWDSSSPKPMTSTRPWAGERLLSPRVELALAYEVIEEVEQDRGRKAGGITLGIAVLNLAEPWFYQVEPGRVIASRRLILDDPAEYKRKLRPVVESLFL